VSDVTSYWIPLCELVSQLRCWARMASRVDGKTWESQWGRLLTVPTPGYLEAAGGPVRIGDIEWVEVSTKRIRGGIAGRPRQMVDIKEEILSGLHATGLTWELRESFWSIEGVFDDESTQVVRVLNPFGPKQAKLS